MYNASESFSISFSFLSQLFKDLINVLDNIIIIGDSTSILDFFVAIIVFSIIFGAVFTVVKVGVSTASSRSGRSGD